jgi:hypothetical protein
MSSLGKLPTHAGHTNPYIVQQTNNCLRNNDLKCYASFAIPGKTEVMISTGTNNTIEHFTVTKKERLNILIPDNNVKRYEFIDCIVDYIFERTSSPGTSQNISFTLRRTLDQQKFVESNLMYTSIVAMNKDKQKEFLKNVGFKQTWSTITSFKLEANHKVLKLTDDASNKYILPPWSILQTRWTPGGTIISS